MYFLGVDLGGTNIAIGITDEKGNLLLKDSTPTKPGRDITEIIRDMGLLSLALIKKMAINISDVTSAGIGSPGIMHPPTGTLVYSNNLQCHNVPLSLELQKYIPLDIYVNNDANCAALGESVAGASKQFKHSVMITLGTGVGSGIIIDDRIYAGAFFGGGEAGHHVIKAGGVKCTCGRYGCWESYASATGLIREATQQATSNKNSLLFHMMENNNGKLNAKMVFDASEKKDETACRVIDNYYEYLACGLTNIVNIFQPEAIVLGGGVSGQGNKLLNRLDSLMSEQIYGIQHTSYRTKLVIASLGNDAGIIGAAMLGKYQ